MTPKQASKKLNEIEVYSNLQNRRVEQQPKSKLGRLLRTADDKLVFSKGDITNWFYKLYTITEVIHDTIPSHRINYLPQRHNEFLLRSTNLTLYENNQVMMKINFFHY